MRTPGLSSLSLVALSFVFAGGCSSGSTGDGSIPQDQYATQQAGITCEALGACCVAGGHPRDVAKCKANVASSTAAKIADPLLAYDPVAAALCLAASRASAKACFADLDTLELACAKVFVGTVANGGSCTRSEQCIVPAGADFARCVNAKCVVEKHGKAGDPCNSSCSMPPGPGPLCVGASSASPATACWFEDGLLCVDGACGFAGAPGGPCVRGACVPTAYCVASGTGDTCVAKGASGAPCPADGSRQTCLDGNYCATGTCAPTKADGATCTAGPECTSRYCDATSKCRLPKVGDDASFCDDQGG